MKFPQNSYTGNDLKQAGQKLALDNSGEWKDQIMLKMNRYVRAMVKGELFGMDEFREYCRLLDVPNPASQNSWGAVPAMACRAGLIEATGQYNQSSIPSAHRRAIQIWRVL